MIKPFTQEEYILRCKLIHGDKYDYSKTIYKSAKDKVIVICRVHGEFEVNARQHYRGHNCPKCFHYKYAQNCLLTQDEVLLRAKSIWGDLFDYSDVNYIGMHRHYNIKCNNCGNIFSQTFDSHLKHKQNGCRTCTPRRGWRRSQWIDFCKCKDRIQPMVYVVRMFNDSESFIKIGITTQSVFDRFNRSDVKYEYEVIKEIKGSPLFVYDKEIELHKLFRRYKYSPLIYFEGHTECFSLDILPLIDQI